MPATAPEASFVLAHGSGVDDILLVALPVAVFLVLQWLSRRRARSEQENGGSGTKDSGAR